VAKNTPGASAPVSTLARGWPAPAAPIPLMAITHDSAVTTIRDRNPFPLDARTGRGAGRGAALAHVLSTFQCPGAPVRCPSAALVSAAAPNLVPAAAAVPRPWLGMPPHAPPPGPALYAAPAAVDLSGPPIAPPGVTPPVSPTVPGEAWADNSTPDTATPVPPTGSVDIAATPTAELLDDVSEPSATRLDCGLHDQQKCLLTFTRPWWLQGEAGISHQVRALLDDHGMDFSAAGLERALAWLLIQRRDIAVHLRAWLAKRTTQGLDPARILDELDYYLLSLEEA